MANKKIKIILLILIAVIALGVLIYLLYQRPITRSESGPGRQAVAELKSAFPDYSAEEVKQFAEIAANNNGLSCRGRSDESRCFAAYAYLKGESDLCHELENEDICLKNVLNKIAKTEIDKCQPLGDNDFLNCLVAFFAYTASADQCGIFMEASAKTACQDIFVFKQALAKYDRKLCDGLATVRLKEYCLNTIVDKNQDTDKDGLTDLDEINKYGTAVNSADTDSDGLSDGQEILDYKTDPKKADTDGDGYSDGDEVKKGYSPNGPGKLK